VGSFLALFMMVFQPFGVTNHDPNFRVNTQFVLPMLAMGIIVSLILIINEFLLRPLLIQKLDQVKLLVWLAWTYILTGSIVFLIYNVLGSWHDFHWSSYLGFLRDVGMVITFPVAGFWFAVRHQALRSSYVNLKSAPSRPSSHMLSFTSENGKDPLLVSAGDVLFLEAEDNYIGINYLENGEQRAHLIRSSLKRLEATLDEPDMHRCHRSFIVNLGRVHSCSGNRHALHLKLVGMSGIVPVSRTYTEAILESLQASPVPHTD